MPQRIQSKSRTLLDSKQVLLALCDTHKPANTAAPNPAVQESVSLNPSGVKPVSNTNADPKAPEAEDRSPRDKPKRARISFEAPLRLNRKLERIARDLDRSKTALLREAVEAYLRKLGEGEGAL